MARLHVLARAVAASMVLAPTFAAAQDTTLPSPTSSQAEEAGGDARSGRLLPHPDLSDAGRAEFAEYERAFELLHGEYGDYEQTVQQIVEVEFRRERDRRLRFYNANIETRRVQERLRRSEAIANFEQFLVRFPEHPELTPDVMFRLAELHFEAAVDEYNRADEAYQLALERYELGIDAAAPTEPRKDFSRTSALFNDLIRRFPEYRQVDGARYLLGICYEQDERYEEALAQYRYITEHHTDSMFAQEAHLRMGEYFFEEVRFQDAREQYIAAMGYGQTKWWDKILFKLGWSYYLLAQYEQAISTFTQLLDFYAEGEREGSAALRQEAMQYFAISLSEVDWNSDGVVDPDFVMGRVERLLGADSTYASETLDRLASVLSENQSHEESIEVNEYAISRFDCDPRNVERALMIVDSLGKIRSFDRALEMQRMLATNFGPGSSWYACQEREGNEEAMARAEQVVKENLVETAARYYLAAERTMLDAEETGNSQLLEEARQQFDYAARIYADFLSSYPGDPLTYEMQLYYAQALLLAGRYEDAAVQFAGVRDSVLSDEYMEVAAAMAIQSYERALQEGIDGGRLEGRAWPAYEGANAWVEPEVDEDPRAPREPVTPVTIPEVSLAWAGAIEAYLRLGLTSEEDPAAPTRYGYQVAKLYYDHQHYPEARAGFERVLDVCNSNIDESGYAAGFLINSYRRAGDDVRELLDDFQTGKYRTCVPQRMLAEILADVTRVSLGQRAERAERYFAEAKYEEAAEEYARIATEYRDDPEFAPLGVWNSGLIYEQQLQRYERAIAQFDRLIAEYPNSEYVDDAWVRIAINAKRFFDFDRAIDAFLTLDRAGFSDPDLVLHPILDAALLMESVGRGREAADAYQRFVRANPRDPRAPGALYSAGVIYDELGDHRAMRTTFEAFRTQYGRTSSSAIDVDAAVVDSYSRSAKAYAAAGDTRNAERELQRLLDEYTTRLPRAPAAGYAAAEVIYNRALGQFRQWDSIQLGESVRTQRAAIERRRDGIEPLVLTFRAVVDYNSADWTVCAFYQEGRVFQAMADLLYRMPVPDFAGDYEAEDEYRLMVENFASQYEDQAIASWETAYPLMRELGVTNQCTIDMTAQLNRYRGAEYPVFRNAVEYEEVNVISPPGVRLPADPNAPPPALPEFDDAETPAEEWK